MSKSLRPAAQLLILTLSLAGPVLSHATLATNVPRGEKTVQVPVLGRNAERCVIPKHVANERYADHDLKDESELCGIDEGSNAAVCPKTNSTNPGLDLYSLPQGLSPARVAGAKCKSAGANENREVQIEYQLQLYAFDSWLLSPVKDARRHCGRSARGA